MEGTLSMWRSIARFTASIRGALRHSLAATLTLCLVSNALGAGRVLYETGFEASEGFSGKFTLAGQNLWTRFGSGGNGIVTNYFQGLGQQAYLGAVAPTSPDDSLSLYVPLDYKPNPQRQEIVTFSVLMAIQDSTTTNRDDFRWSAYNSKGQRLFSLDFANQELQVSYGLDDGKGFISTGVQFTNDSLYELTVQMNFGRNLWSASANGLNLVNGRPITTKFDGVLDLADIDAVWLPRDPKKPGDNYMLFDNYRVAVEYLDVIPPMLEAVGRLPDGKFLLRVLGEPGVQYQIQASTDLKSWTVLQSALAPSSGAVDFLDMDAPRSNQRFYRAVASKP
ncbi:MAG: hypothetical protein FJ404_07135 [Verrucomicrobia bacterium]|nr:hypothetical protein [Verrucomicrobiota bacterium]